MRAAGDSINETDHTIAEMKRVQRQAGNVKIDLVGLRSSKNFGWRL